MSKSEPWWLPLLLVLIWIASSHNPAFALGMENLGDQPITRQPDWPEGVMDVINVKKPVYSYWCNGNENFYFHGNTSTLNEALKKFAAIQAPPHEVVILPGPGTAKTFDGKLIACDWELNLPSGIFLALAKRAITRPALTIHLDESRIKLSDIEIPSGIIFLSPKDLLEKYLAELKNKNAEVRKFAIYRLSSLEVYSEYAILPILGMLNNTDLDVRIQAATSLGTFGAKAYAALPTLRSGLQNPSKSFAIACREAIAKIEAEDKEPLQKQKAITEEINRFVQTRKK
jgi:hypothetical protein